MSLGCKKAPTIHVDPAPAATLPGGWTKGASKDGTVSVGIPNGWRQGVDKMTDGLGDLSAIGGGSTPSTDPEASQMGQDIANMSANMKREADEQEQKQLAKLESLGIIVHAINGSKQIPGEARTRFYVRRYRKDSNATWEDAKATERQEYVHAQTPQEVKLPIGKALKYSEDEEMRDGGVVHKISYVIVDGASAYSLRFVTEESAETISSIADQVAQTWRIQVK